MLIDCPDTGERKTIEECVLHLQPTIYGLSVDGKIRPTSVSHWVESGIKPCYRVRTRLGRTVEVTEHHPFLTVSGWKSLSQLCIGAHIAVPTQIDCFGDDESWGDIRLVRLLAYYIAEGGLTHNIPRLSNADPTIVEDFKQVIATHFP